MMSVLDYALDVKKSVEEVLKKCNELGIDVSKEDDMLEDEHIILLDNVINTKSEEVTTEVDYDEDEELEETAMDLMEKANINVDTAVKKEKLSLKESVSKKEKEAYYKNKKNMYKSKQKLQANKADTDIVSFSEGMNVGDFVKELGVESSLVVKKLIELGMMLNINSLIPFETAEIIALEFGKELKKSETLDESNFEEFEVTDKKEDLEKRPPVVTIMGHVDHGKTTLLDTIRKSKVASGEAGGITQHIGAYQVPCDNKKITFVDTPGHAAFTEMRARGASITDIVIVIVAADDGVMPQTKEAIEHAKAAEVPIIVAINKIDKPNINLDKLYSELANLGLNPEEWGGETMFNKVSALTGEGIDSLLDNILLIADMSDLKANPNRYAIGTVVESKVEKNVGTIATLLIQNGTLRLGDPIVVGAAFGKVRTMENDLGEQILKAYPSTPVSITGLNDVPLAGDRFMAYETEKEARTIGEQRKKKSREKRLKCGALSLDDLFAKIEEGAKEIKVVLKADVKGSEEAVRRSLEAIEVDGVRISVIRSDIGPVSESDITLAAASDALIISFNVKSDATTNQYAKKCEVKISNYKIIYKVVEDIQKAMKGMLDPEFEEKELGKIEVRKLFKFSKVGVIAGSYVLEGVAKRGANVRVIRKDKEIHEGKIATLQREKEQVKQVKAGIECGLTLEDFDDLKEGDILEVFKMEEIQRI